MKKSLLSTGAALLMLCALQAAPAHANYYGHEGTDASTSGSNQTQMQDRDDNFDSSGRPLAGRAAYGSDAEERAATWHANYPIRWSRMTAAERAEWRASHPNWQANRPHWDARHARWERAYGDDNVRYNTVAIRAEDRAEIRGAIASQYRMNCPLGNSHGHSSTGCMQPFLTRTDFIGEPVSMTAMPISAELASRISAPPVGYHYVQSGTDVMLVNDNGQIADAVTLYSAMHADY